MGIFDWVNVNLPCPHCGKDLYSFQTKDGNPYSNCVDPDQISNFYTECDHCKKWVEYHRDFESKPRETPFGLHEIKELGFKLLSEEDANQKYGWEK